MKQIHRLEAQISRLYEESEKIDSSSDKLAYEKLIFDIEFREDALQAIAKKAMERKTGARGLRSILEHILLDTMYDLPSTENVSKVVIDAGVVTGDSSPILIYEEKAKKKAKAAKD